MGEWTLVLAFAAGLIPSAVFCWCVLYLIRSWCVTLQAERDALRRAYDDIERRYAGVTLEDAMLQLEAPRAPSVEQELALLRQERMRVLRRQERIGRTLRDIRDARDEWLRGRKSA